MSFDAIAALRYAATPPRAMPRLVTLIYHARLRCRYAAIIDAATDYAIRAMLRHYAIQPLVDDAAICAALAATALMPCQRWYSAATAMICLYAAICRQLMPIFDAAA